MVRYGNNTSCIACYLVTHSGTFTYIQKNSTHLQGKQHTVCKQVTQAMGAVWLDQRLLQNPVLTLCVMQMFIRMEEMGFQAPITDWCQTSAPAHRCPLMCAPEITFPLQ